MPGRDIASRGADEWRPWHLPRLSGDPWRGSKLPQRHPVFRPNEPALRPLRVGVSHRIYQSLKRTVDTRLLHRLLTQSPIHVFVIPVGGTLPPPGFDRSYYVAQAIEAVENWAQYVTSAVGDQTRWSVRSAAGGEAIESWLDVDDAPFRRRAGLPPDGPFTLPTAEDTSAGAAFQTLVAKALRCDLYVTDFPALIDLDGETGYKYPIEAVSPKAAVPLIGLYLRRLGRYRVEHDYRLGRRRRELGTRRDEDQSIVFFHTAVRSVLWATFEWGMLSSKVAAPADANEFKLFADTMLHRLEQALRERDRLLQLLAVAPAGIAAGYVAGHSLDTILLLSLAALDASAEAVNKVFGLGVDKPAWNSSGFTTKLAKQCEGLFQLFQANTGGDHYRVWKVLSELRNSIHSEAISHTPTIFVVHDFPGRVLLPIPTTRFRKVRDHFDAMGGLERWGIFEAVHSSDRAHLHPGEFVEALIPRLFALIHRIMIATLQAKDDPASRSRGDRYGRPLSEPEQDALRLLGLERVAYDAG